MAEECRSIAANMRIPELREQVLDLARQWDQLAEERMKLLKLRERIEEDTGAPNPTPELDRPQEDTEPHPAPASNGSGPGAPRHSPG